MDKAMETAEENEAILLMPHRMEKAKGNDNEINSKAATDEHTHTHMQKKNETPSFNSLSQSV